MWADACIAAFGPPVIEELLTSKRHGPRNNTHTCTRSLQATMVLLTLIH